MKRIVRWLFGVVVALGIIIQFFQPERNLNETNNTHLFSVAKVAPEIQTLLKDACLDCHSNHTTYLWYHRMAPVSWMVNKHVTEGKKELNLSEWAKLDRFDQIALLDEMAEEITEEKMPLKSYQLMHPKARLSEEQRKQLSDWLTQLAEEKLKN